MQPWLPAGLLLTAGSTSTSTLKATGMAMLQAVCRSKLKCQTNSNATQASSEVTADLEGGSHLAALGSDFGEGHDIAGGRRPWRTLQLRHHTLAII